MGLRFARATEWLAGTGAKSAFALGAAAAACTALPLAILAAVASELGDVLGQHQPLLVFVWLCFAPVAATCALVHAVKGNA
jgi:hypothetical protein